MSSLFGISAGGETEFYPYKINNSLRLDRTNSHSLDRTPSSAGNRQTHTISIWVKRAELSRTTRLFMATNNSSNATFHILEFNSDDTIRYYAGTEGSSAILNVQTNAEYRDVSGWYHIVAALDSTQATSSNRVKLYVNGTQITDLKNSTYGSQNASYQINNTVAHYINRDGSSLGNQYGSYYATEINFIDGQQLDPTSFGQFKSGVWIPKDTSGLTFGTNGFRLEFGDSSAIGDDTSGNTNDFTATNLSTHDVMPDTPTVNYAVLNAIWQRESSATLTEGNLFATCTGNNSRGTVSTLSMTSGKWYAEFDVGPSGQNRQVIGICNMDANTGNTALSSASDAVLAYGDVLDDVFVDGVDVGNINYGNGNVMAFAVNMDDSEVSIYKNGVLQITVSKTFTAGGNYGFMIAQAGSSSTGTFKCGLNFGQDSTFAGAITGGSGNADENGFGDFKYAVPSGFLALNSANLADTSITPKNNDLPEDYFEANLWTGNGSSQSISSYEFAPDWVWMKERSSTSSYMVQDTLRGTGVFIQTNSDVDDTSTSNSITSFDSNGFTLGDGGSVNQNNQTYVGWAWEAGGTPTATNSAGAGNVPTSGSVLIDRVASTATLAGTIPVNKLSANTKAGFSIQTWTGDSSGNATIAHGLTEAPDMIIVKPRGETREWLIWHQSFGDNDKGILFTTAAPADNRFGPDAPTSTVYGLYSGQGNRNGTNFVGYAFHSVEGYSKFGSYIGTGNSEGAFVYTGFRPSFVMHKRTDSTGDWFIFDNKRDGFNPENKRLRPNADNDTEADPGDYDIVSNGFKIRFTSGNVNASGGTYIYMAFAEMPVKYANAR